MVVCSITFAVSNNNIPCMCWSVSVGLKLWFCVCCLCPRILNTWLHVCVMWLLSCCHGKYIQMKLWCVVGERKWSMKCWDLGYGGTVFSIVVVIFRQHVEEESFMLSWCNVSHICKILCLFLFVTVLKDKFVSVLNYLPFRENVSVSDCTWNWVVGFITQLLYTW